MESLKIVMLSIGAAVVYGILHDQVTARVCVEYFTIGHPAIFDTDSPTWLGLGWGVIATWWVGLLLGAPLAVAARYGEWPKREVAELLVPIVRLLLVMAGAALMAGVIGYFLANMGAVWLVGSLRDAVPREKHAVFLADLWAHSASYGIGLLGGVVLCWRVYSQRRLELLNRLKHDHEQEHSPNRQAVAAEDGH